jgi:hypothetical protein
VFNNWKTQVLQAFARPANGGKRQENAEATDPKEDPQVLRLRRMLADLRCGDVMKDEALRRRHQINGSRENCVV